MLSSGGYLIVCSAQIRICLCRFYNDFGAIKEVPAGRLHFGGFPADAYGYSVAARFSLLCNKCIKLFDIGKNAAVQERMFNDKKDVN